jgi:hypothetical protein
LRYLSAGTSDQGEIVHSKLAILVFCSTALGLLVAGCGGSGNGSEGEQIDKATFVKQADAICQKTSGRLSAEVTAIASKESGNPNDFTAFQVKLVTQTLIPGLETELKELRALGVPDEGKQQVQAFFKASQQVIDKAKANPKAFAESGSYEAAELAGRRYGVSKCPIAPVEAS